ncbi:nitrate ABC transporter ATP-binding protein [Bordetella genomosp. 8]|uniref:Nitrate ABC transporter ATP-binding protein n=1 Tax=Bordetella genomosp. 8 TaxID=1416806 RepID=A0A1W6YH58_9BORD|nr:ABC transporter ATP-binding protein [Bordetella genomosp. 8]ARP80407.1 nitrate ABC transporter ATP-binding protein [Bordetella genomosp. 8]
MSFIAVRNLSKRYGSRHGDVMALRDVNLSIREGEFVSIVGPSGCGKSTLLYLIGGFLQAGEGTIEAAGKRVTGPGVDRGVVFQEYALFPWLTVAGNIEYGLKEAGKPPSERERIVRHYVNLIGLAGFENRYPKELSGGMKQRVAIARTLACGPRILLLDEPLGALDAQTREGLQDELLRLWQATSTTVIMITHDVSEAVYLSSRIMVMSRRPGTLVEEFGVDLDHSQGREALMLSDAFNALRNKVWLSVRRQAVAEAEPA